MDHNKITGSPKEKFGTYSPGYWTNFLIECSRRLSYSKYLKPVSSLCRKLALKYFIKGPIDYQFFDAYARFQPRRNLAEKRCLLKPAAFDSVEFDFMKSQLSEGGIFLDVGANVGFYSLFAARCVGISGRVFSFEPNPVVLERLLCNISLNDGRQDMAEIIPIPIAVTDKAGTIPFILPDNNLGEGRIIDHANESLGHVFNVEGARLFDVLEEHFIANINIMKIDIEGHELNALKPFFADAPNSLYPEFIIIERGDREHWEQLFNLCRTAGYKEHKSCHMNVILKK